MDYPLLLILFKMETNKLFLVGLLLFMVCSSIFLFLIATRDSYDVINPTPDKPYNARMIPNKIFDYSVVGIFVSLLLIAVGSTFQNKISGGNENDETKT